MKPSLDLTRDTITIATKDGAKETQTVKLPGTHGETYQNKGLLTSCDGLTHPRLRNGVDMAQTRLAYKVLIVPPVLAQRT
jgi:hypothetical protein